MGTLADGNLRHKRILAHQALEQLRQARRMDKWAVYVWLQGKLKMEPEQVHIGMFSEEMCDQVISLCRESIKPNQMQAA